MKKDAARPRTASGLSVAGWPLRRKLALALAIPLLLAAVLGGLRVQSDLAESRNNATTAKQVTVLPPAIKYLNSAELAMVAAQSDTPASRGDLVDAIANIEEAADALNQAAGDAELNDRQAAQVAALLDISQAMRGQSAADLGPATWIAQVRQTESSVTQLITSITAVQVTPEPRLEQVSQALAGRMSLAMQQALVVNGELTESTTQELFSEIGVEASAIDRLATGIGTSEEAIAELRTANTVHAGNVRQGVADNMGGRDAFVPYDQLTTNLLEGVEQSLDEAASNSQTAALIGALVTLGALAAAVLLALLIAKLLLDPITRVREGALSVARHRLPDAVAAIRSGQEPEPIKPIGVTTNEEIGQLARAVDDLHRQAIHLASGEAQLRQTVNAMFVTLSRRSNSLVNQQLAQIERLEQDEEDPKRLESLFRLDHLASRMRRTGDSLLILADAPNRAAGQYTLTVGESLQAATSGVTDYQRVHILSHLNTRVDADAAADVVHLLTELVDNALSYSPPSEPVKLNATLAADGVTITVTDAGLGVPDSELESLNADLEGGAEATPDTARRMGLFVVSRLSARHGITARLRKNTRGNGMTATVLLPPSILPELPAYVPPPAAPAARTAAPAAPVREDLGVTVDEKAVAAEPTPTATPPAASAPATPAPTPDRPPLGGGLLPKREPGANMPLTGAEAFLPPETPTASGPLFGKRDKPAGEAGAPTAAPAERVASVVPITALAARQRAMAEEEARAARTAPEPPAAEEPTAEEPTAEEPPAAEEPTAEEPTAEEPTSSEPVAQEPVEEPVREEPVAEEPAEQEPVAEEPVREEPAEEPVAEEPAEPEPEPVREEPVAQAPLSRTPDPLSDPLTAPWQDPEAPVAPPQPEPVVQTPPQPEPAPYEPEPAPYEPVAPAAQAPVETAPAASVEPAGLGATALAGDALSAGLAGGLPSRTRGSAPEINRDMPGLPSRDGLNGGGLPSGDGLNGGGLPSRAPTRSASDSPIFRSMRSGWLASPGEGEWHQTEVEKGWEIAEQVIEETPVVESTSVGLPVRQPGERLVPGSVSQPTQAKTRDPEAIRRRLSSHTAGVARGRRAATSSTQHTEAGPA